MVMTAPKIQDASHPDVGTVAAATRVSTDLDQVPEESETIQVRDEHWSESASTKVSCRFSSTDFES
jgi:hypothetical protein